MSQPPNQPPPHQWGQTGPGSQQPPQDSFQPGPPQQASPPPQAGPPQQPGPPPWGAGQPGYDPSRPAYGAPSFPIVVRYNWVPGVVFIVLGALLLLLVTLGESSPVYWVTGPIFIVLGVLYTVGKAVLVHPDRVEVRSPMQITLKKVPMHGLADLHLDGNKLYRSGDNKKLVNLGWGSVNSGDLRALRSVLEAGRR